MIVYIVYKRKDSTKRRIMNTVYHCSPAKIGTIKKSFGQFGGALFFTHEPYSLSDSPFTYEISLRDEDVIEVSSLECDETVSEIKDLASRFLDLDICDDIAWELMTAEETIFSLLDSENTDVDFSDASEFDWAIQGLQAEAANKMGYLAVHAHDEQGSVYIINLVNKEHLIELSESM